jgi:hypothetical protein
MTESPANLPRERVAFSEKSREISVILKAELYEVDDAFYKKLSKAKRLSIEDLEKLERIYLDSGGPAVPAREDPIPPKQKQPEGESWFKFLEKQKLLVAGKETKLDEGKEGTLVSLNKTINCLPSPEQIRKGDKRPQTVQEGVSLLAQPHISSNRRHVRVKFTEKSVELEGIDKVKVLQDNEGTEAIAEVPYLKEAGHSRMRDIPDGGTFLLPLQYRPRAAKDNGRWLVLKITTRIYMEQEERRIREHEPK